MKSIFITIAALCVLAVSALAAPSAEVALNVLDAETLDGQCTLTVEIAVTAPGEPYASLDFNLITSSYDSLRVVDLDDDPEVTDLDIDFAPGYGNAYHGGQDDPATGGYRYLIGVFSQSTGNNITDAVTVCTLRLSYSQGASATLQVRDLKLVYVDKEGGVAAAPVASENAVLTIDGDTLALLDGDSVPLEGAQTPLSDAPASSFSWILYAVIALAAAIGLTAVLVFRSKKATADRSS